MDVTEPVRAAGGIVWRPGPSGGPREILVIHRARYDDWSLPKGKLDPGESVADGAMREVLEETGLRCTLGPVAGTVTYRDRFGRPKSVVYFEMHPPGGPVDPFEPGDEVDRIVWLPPERAAAMVTYAHDRELLIRFAARS